MFPYNSDAFLEGLFDSQQTSQCIYDDPSHETLSNGVCKTCDDIGMFVVISSLYFLIMLL